MNLEMQQLYKQSGGGGGGGGGGSGKGDKGDAGVAGVAGAKGDAGVAGVQGIQGATGPSGPSGGTGVLDGLDDVVVLSPEADQVLAFDAVSSKWINRPATTETTFTRTDVLQVIAGIARFYPLKSCKITSMWAWVGLASVGSPVTFDLLKNGVIVSSGSIAAGQFQMVIKNNLNIPLLTSDYLTLNVTGIGSSTPGSELRLRLQFI